MSLVFMMLALLAFGQSAWVETEIQLLHAIEDGQKSIKLDADIQLSKYLDIDGRTLTLDLNGHKLSRRLNEHGSAGHVIWAHNGSDLKLTSSLTGGSIEGGKANNGGAIHIPHGNKVTANNVIFRNNSAADHAGAIWNNGEFTAVNCNFENNKAKDVGAIYNAKTDSGCGIATLTYCSFTGNEGTKGAGALANAVGATAMTIEDCTIKGNIAGTSGGGIWNGGTIMVTNSMFEDNVAVNAGAVYNAVRPEGAGTATLSNCTFTGNVGTAGAGALGNDVGATVMTIEDCTITGNTAGTSGGGIWNGGTLNMKGEVTVTDNKIPSDVEGNVFLKNGKGITVTGDLTGSSVGIELESFVGTFTNGYSTYNSGVEPNTIFTADILVAVNVVLDDNGEACLTSISDNLVYYIERSWDEQKEQVISTQKAIAGDKIVYDAFPEEGQYKEVTNKSGSLFQMGGFSASGPEYYVVRGNVNCEHILVMGKDVHLILCDNATLTVTGGIELEEKHILSIHCQSYDDNRMGRLMVSNGNEKAAGIGGAFHNGNVKHVGNLVVYGGHIEVVGGEYGAGIGSSARSSFVRGELCGLVTVYGGYVKATGGKSGAGIGGGAGYNEFGVSGGDFILYDGMVVVQGGENAAGLGGGGNCTYDDYKPLGNGGWGATVTVYGGTLKATGGEKGAGIGSGIIESTSLRNFTGNSFTMKGGTVIAEGGAASAGIGGGYKGGGAYVKISGGTVSAYGGYNGAGIGGGLYSFGGTVSISGGTVHAYGSVNGAGIGGGFKGDGAFVTITGGIVVAKAGYQGDVGHRAIGPGKDKDQYLSLNIGNDMMVGAGNNGSVERIYFADERKNACWYRSYAEISPCTHSGATYTVSGTTANDTHTIHCKYCTTSSSEKHDFDENGECGICHFKGTANTVTIYLPDANDDDTYATDGVYKSYTVDIVKGTSFTLPGSPQDLQDMEFAGWLVTTMEGTPSFSSYKASETETLQAVGTPYTLNENVCFVARYKDIAISLADDGDNYETIYTYDGKTATSVSLTGRTLYKNGSWNTLCLPFAVTDGDENDGVTFSGTPLEGAMVLMLGEATFENSTLTLNFQETKAMEPGMPYLVKWANDNEHPTILNPVFSGVTISNTPTSDKAVIAGIVSFTGQYAPLNIGEEGDETILFLGDDNTFRYPDNAVSVNAFRAYFQANTSLGDVNGDGIINVTDVTMLVNYILGMEDEHFILENADITRDGIISVTDVTALTDIILGGNRILKVVVNGADGLTFSAGGSGPARISKKLK